MKLKAYMLLLSTMVAKVELTADALKEARRVLGPQTSPMMAWEKGAAIGFISADTARQTTDKIKSALGEQMQILVVELGSDQYQWGLPYHHDWLAKLSWSRAPQKTQCQMFSTIKRLCRWTRSRSEDYRRECDVWG